MNTERDPRELATALCTRSKCAVQVAAVLSDGFGVYAWGWNHSGDGFGQHAEHHALIRANIHRLRNGCTHITVASKRERNGKPLCSRPCDGCMRRIVAAGVVAITYRNHAGKWITENI